MRAFVAEPLDRALQPFLRADLWLPPQYLLCLGDVGAAAFWVIDATGFKDNAGRGVTQSNDRVSKFEYRMLFCTPKVNDFTRRMRVDHRQQ